MVPLSTVLKNGDIVEVLTQKNSHPSLDWLNFVKTAGARNRIRQWYKRSHREENVARGRELLEKEMGKSGFEALLKSQPMQWVVERCNYHAVDDLLAALGYGELTLNLVVNRLRDAIRATQPLEPDRKQSLKGESVIPSSSSASSSAGDQSSPIVGIEGLLYYLAGCCNPIPGELIIGVVTRGRGISIHRQGCQNVENVEGDRLIPVSWNGKNHKSAPSAMTYIVQVQIQTIDRVGILKDILSRLSDQGINVRNVDVKTQTGKPAVINLGMEIRDRPQLESVFTQIRNMSDILNIRRLGQAEDGHPESE
jgi:(p)ppGpp synthase/HD superfamily hydrolase